MELVPYKIVNFVDGPRIEVTMESGTLPSIFSPESLLALIIAKIKENAERATDTMIKNAVVTVPGKKKKKTLANIFVCMQGSVTIPVSSAMQTT